MFALGNYFTNLKDTLDNMPLEKIEEVIGILQTARLNGKQIFIMGNGGSASTATHMVCDFAKRTRVPGWPNVRVIGLTDNMAIFSAYANDEGYDTVFAEQLNNLVNPGDIVIGISASGNSPNVLNGIHLANTKGAKTIGLVGLDGGKLLSMVNFCLHVPTNRIDQAEDVHLILGHMISEALAVQAEYINSLEVKKLAPAKIGDGNDKLIESLFGQPIELSSLPHDTSSEISESRDLLSHISHEFAAKLDLHSLLTRILGMTVNYVGALSGSIVVLDEKGDVIDGASAYPGIFEEKPCEVFTETVRNGLAGWVVENKRPAIIEDTKNDPRWLSWEWENSRSAISIPLMTMERVVGVLTLTRMQTQQFNMEDLSLLSAITLTLSYSFGLGQSNC